MKKLIFLLFFTIIIGQDTSDDSTKNFSIVSTTNVFSEFFDSEGGREPE